MKREPLTVGCIARLFDIDKSLVKLWSKRFAEYLSKPTNREGEPRIYTQSDLKVFAVIYENYDPSDDESSRGAQKMVQDAHEMEMSIPLGPFLQGGGDALARQYGPLRYNYHNWMRKVKKALDPNTASDPDSYILADE